MGKRAKKIIRGTQGGEQAPGREGCNRIPYEG